MRAVEEKDSRSKGDIARACCCESQEGSLMDFLGLRLERPAVVVTERRARRVFERE